MITYAENVCIIHVLCNIILLVFHFVGDATES